MVVFGILVGAVTILMHTGLVIYCAYLTVQYIRGEF